MSSIAAVKIAQKQNNISDTKYRNLLKLHFNATSCTALTERQRGYLIRIMTPITNIDTAPTTQKIYALWYELKPLLAKTQQTHAYLLGFCRKAGSRQEPLASLDDLTPAEAYKSIEALKVKLNQLDALPF